MDASRIVDSLDEGERERERGQVVSISIGRGCSKWQNGGSRPVSEHAYSIYGYFLYGRPFPSAMGTHRDLVPHESKKT